MKIKKIINILTILTALVIFASCSKSDDNFFYKGYRLPVTIKGYNGSNEQLVVKIDTFKFKFDLIENSTISLSDIYTFIGPKTSAKLTITEKSSGKVILEREIDKEEKNVVVNIVYIDDKIITVDPPVANPNTNKVGLYIVNNENNNPADLLLFDENVELLTTIGRNISPNKWVYLDIDFMTTKTEDLQLPIFFKAGSSQAEEDGYFKDSMWSSYISGNPFFPTDGKKGQVRSFVITHDGQYTFAIQIQ